MESNRKRHRLTRGGPRDRQAGITFIGLLFLVVVFGAVGFAVLRIVPLYMERMQIGTVLDDVENELATGGNTIVAIRNALESRFYIDNVDIKANEMEVVREGDGYVIRVNKELRAPFVADLWFLVLVDEQVQIAR